MKFKTPKVQERFQDMCELAQDIARELDHLAQKHFNVEITLTETVTTEKEDEAVLRKSDTHRTRRAFDVRTNDLPEGCVAYIIKEIRKKYGMFGALANNQKNLIVYKPHGTGPHLHVQVSRKFQLPTIAYKENTDGKEETTN